MVWCFWRGLQNIYDQGLKNVQPSKGPIDSSGTLFNLQYVCEEMDLIIEIPYEDCDNIWQ